MGLKITILSTLLAIVLLPFVGPGGCGSSGSCDPAFYGLSGIWDIHEQESSSENMCNRTYDFTVDITQSGSTLLIQRDDGSDALEVQFCGNTFQMPTPYSYREDNGTTTVTSESWTVLSPTSGTGRSTWTWQGDGGLSCQGQSTLTATKQP